jgi:hypothetical protein
MNNFMKSLHSNPDDDPKPVYPVKKKPVEEYKKYKPLKTHVPKRKEEERKVRNYEEKKIVVMEVISESVS